MPKFIIETQETVSMTRTYVVYCEDKELAIALVNDGDADCVGEGNETQNALKILSVEQEDDDAKI